MLVTVDDRCRRPPLGAEELFLWSRPVVGARWVVLLMSKSCRFRGRLKGVSEGRFLGACCRSLEKDFRGEIQVFLAGGSFVLQAETHLVVKPLPPLFYFYLVVVAIAVAFLSLSL